MSGKSWKEDTRICKWCEEKFIVKGRTKLVAKSRPKLFCSAQCRYSWHNENSPDERRRNRANKRTTGSIDTVG